MKGRKNMNYLLFNPKSNNGNNDINIIDKSIGGRELVKINLLDIDVKEFVPTLTENDKVFLCGGDGTICRFANNTYGFEFPCPVYIIQSGTGNDFLRARKSSLTSMVVDLFIDIKHFVRIAYTKCLSDIV